MQHIMRMTMCCVRLNTSLFFVPLLPLAEQQSVPRDCTSTVRVHAEDRMYEERQVRQGVPQDSRGPTMRGMLTEKTHNGLYVSLFACVRLFPCIACCV